MQNRTKRMMKRVTIGVILLSMLVGCHGFQATGEGELRLAISSPLNTLNHIINTEAVNSQVIGNFLEGLLTYDAQQNIVGSMAEKWDVSNDGLTYTFTLKDGIEWANGWSVTAHDFVFGWQTLASEPRAGYAQMLVDANIKNAKAVIAQELPPSELGVVAQNDKVLVVTLDAPCVFFEKVMAFGAFLPLNQKFYHNVGGADGYGTSADTVLANGPFVLTVWEPDAQYVLERNENYWDAANVKLEKVTTRVVKEPMTQATLYDNGEIDRLGLGADIYDRYKDSPNIIRQDEASWFYLYLSGENGEQSPVLKNRNFRAAIAHVIDKEIMTEQILKNGSLPADYLVPQKFDKLGDVDFRTYAKQFNKPIFNIDKANEYLAKAKAELGSIPLKFELVISDGVVSKKLYENVKAQIEQSLPGVHVTLRVIPSNTFFNTLKEFNTNASTGGWGADYVDVDTFFSIFRKNDAHNFGRWTNTQYDNLLLQAGKERDKQKRWDYFVQAEKILIEDYSVIPLFQRGSAAIMNEKVKGYRLNPVSPEVFFKYVYFE